jgi:hypothetical protein
MIERQLLDQIDLVIERDRRLRYRRALALAWFALALGAVIFLLSNSQPWRLALAVPVLCVAGLAAALLARRHADRAATDAVATARRIEARFPALDAKLLAAVEQVQAAAPASLGYLQQTVVRQALEHGEQADWRETVPSLSLSRWGFAQGAASLALLAALAALIVASRPFSPSGDSPSNLVTTPATTPAANTLTVEPGDISIERGTSLIVTARFSHAIPAGTSLILEGPSPTLANATTTRTISMTASLDDPLAGARVPNITRELSYRVIAEGLSSPVFRVTVFDFPQLVKADATLRYPDYTSLSEKVIPDTRQVTAVEGSRVTWSLTLNKPVASAKLLSDAGEALALAADEKNAAVVRCSMIVMQSRRYKLQLVDEAGRRAKREVEFAVTVLPNKVPDLKLVFPRRDLRVSPIEEALVVAEAWDDFGLKEVGMTYSLAGGQAIDVTLAKDAPAKSKLEVSRLLSFESMNAQPDQLLSYHFWADDVGPDGKARRTFSDMYFAEVRPFEEIFREGQAPDSQEQQRQQQQQQQGAQRQIGETIKGQREIITATWNVIRRETGEKPSAPFAEDAAAIRDSQNDALEKTRQAKEELQDPQSLAHVEAVEKHMTDAVTHLTDAAANNAPSSLRLALPAEQAAYQALLKLQAREHEVVRQQRQRQQQQGQQQGQQQAGPSQQQLNELELKKQDNRYETQRQAQEQQEPETAAQRETKQALNRLRDLARRQQDLNEKLKEMELAMQEAQTQEQKEELARQLKRLREQQEEMLRDVDELKNRMEQAQQSQQQQSQQQNQQNQNQQAQNQQNQNQRNPDQKQNQKEADKGKQKQETKNLADREQERQAQVTKQKVEDVRQNVREATEALEKGLTSKALAEGTRAERALSELREDFRKRASGQFADDVKDLRKDARQLAEKQEDLGKKMEELDKAGPRSLRDKGERKEVADALGEQKEKLAGITDRIRKVTEEAQATEPLLSKQLYDTLRNADQGKVEQALDLTKQLLDKGLNDEAKGVEPQARRGLDELKKGVEKAAESVLGDEAESLRRAQRALDDLTKQVEREAGERGGPRDDEKDSKRGGPSAARPGGEEKGNQPVQAGEKIGQRPDRQPGKAGEKSGQRPGQQPAQGGEKAGQQPGQQPGQAGEKSGQQPGQAGEKSGQQPGSQRGQSGEKSGQQPGQQPGQSGEKSVQQPGQRTPTKGSNPTFLDQARSGGASGGGGPQGPITGEEYREWSDRLRDVEEMIDDPKLREEVARVRDRAKAMRAEFKRHSKEPQWDDVRKQIAQPLAELRDKLADELARRDQKRDLVPIDRDPVPSQFGDIVKQYYEKLGGGE